MTRRDWILTGWLWALAASAAAQTAAPTPAARDPRWAVVVSGASGGPDYAAQLATWRQGIQAALTSRFGFPATQVVQLVDETARESGTVASATPPPRVHSTNLPFAGSDPRKSIALDPLGAR